MISATDLDPELSILVVSYQSAADIEACLASLPAGVGDRRAEVVVVDNASTDGSADLIAAHDVPVRLVRHAVNVGFAAAVNAAARVARGQWLVLFNPDATAGPGAFDALLDFAAAHPEYGIYGGRTVDEQGHLDPRSCWAAPTVRSLLFATLGLSTAFPRTWLDPEAMGGFARDSVREVDVVTGCLLLTRARTWAALGGFDERYWVYGEDLDLSTRARAAGLRPAITPTATVVHTVGGSSTSDNKAVLVTAGRLTWVLVHWHGPRRFAGVWLTRLAVGVRAALAGVTGRGTKWQAAWARRPEWWNGFPPVTAPRDGGQHGTADGTADAAPGGTALAAAPAGGDPSCT